MKTDESLRQKLDAWQVGVETPRRFAAEVWQRIAVREAIRRHSVWREVVRSFFAGLGTPRYATAAILIAAAVGAGAAHVQTGSTNSRLWKTLEVRYVNSIDPLEHISAN